MIGRIHQRGSRVGGLVRYLFGPGKREEHIDARVVSGWLDARELQPPVTANGETDVRRLIAELEKPVIGAGVDFAKRVWHCSLRNAATDRILTDTEWDHIAQHVMTAVGLSGDADTAGVRWMAIRHNDDHIHIVATLVTENGRIEKAWNDQYKLRDACQEIEHTYGLASTAPADRTAPRRPALAELSKAARAGRVETWRDQLRREVRTAAAAVSTPEEFLARLRGAGVMVKVRHSTVDPDVLTGYAVALPGHKTREGELVYYSGGKLAADLSLPRLRQRWGLPTAPPSGSAASSRQVGTREYRTRLLDQTRAAVDRAAEHVRDHAVGGPEAVVAVAQAGSDVLASVMRASEGPGVGRLWAAAESFDRASRERHNHPVPDTGHARRLRALSRQLAKTGRISGSADQKAARLLLDSLARLSDSVAELRRAQQRLHQAADAHRASTVLRDHAATGVQQGASAHSREHSSRRIPHQHQPPQHRSR